MMERFLCLCFVWMGQILVLYFLLSKTQHARLVANGLYYYVLVYGVTPPRVL